MSNRREQAASKDLGGSLGASTAQAIDQMIRWPFWLTGATMDLVLQGMERMTGQTKATMMGEEAKGQVSMSDHGTSSGTFSASGGSANWMNAGRSSMLANDQDLSGDDLKYVLWSILFCKPGYEAVLEPQQDDIINYSADGASYAAVKIAKYLEKARNGRTERPQMWTEKGYPGDAANVRRSEPANIAGGGSGSSSAQDRGWRIPAEDHKYIKFVYRVERRLPKEEAEVTRVERVTIERGVDTRTSVA